MVVRTAEEERVDSVKNPAHECTTVRGRESARRKCVGDAGERGGKSETQDGGCGVISPFQTDFPADGAPPMPSGLARPPPRSSREPDHAISSEDREAVMGNYVMRAAQQAIVREE
ncbi:Os04g0218300 [Oryza sativa Japonica Group]|uniref:Os04g0218300 protein n=1 Tax=Oryza sativa subsp. japonica TaxID=39947 RepID=A0A0P0W819_ORYSJ|nr:Os04g0218300 [Oryza sativa Japonica Group]